MAAGTLFFNDRDVDTDFALVAITGLSGLPGQLTGLSRDIALLQGPEMSGAVVDSRLIRRKTGSVTIAGRIETASPELALAKLDALQGTVGLGEIAIRTCYAPDRQCLAILESFEGSPHQPEIVNGNVNVTMRFVVKDGLAQRLQPDGYALSAARTACPIGTAESRPVVLLHGGGGTLTNPRVIIRNAAGDPVQNVEFTVSLGVNDALRIDGARAQISRINAGVVSDALAAGLWTSGDFGLVLRPYDGFGESGVYSTVELSSSGGVPSGRITYRRRYA